MRKRILSSLIVLAGMGLSAPSAEADPCIDLGGTTAGNMCSWTGVYGNSNYPGKAPSPLKADLYRRINVTAEPGSPVDGQTDKKVIIFLHGGGFTASLPGAYTDMHYWAKWAANAGYLGITAQYHEAPDLAIVGSQIQPSGLPKYPDCPVAPGTTPEPARVVPCYRPVALEAMRNVQTLVRHIKGRASEFGIDPSKIYVMGDSAGSATAFNVATRSDEAGNPAFPGGAAADIAVRDAPGMWNVSSTVAGAFSSAGTGCYPTWTDLRIGQGFLGTKYAIHFGSCLVNSVSTGDAPVLAWHGLLDGYAPVDTTKDGCAYQRTVAGASSCDTRYYRPYPEVATWPGTAYETSCLYWINVVCNEVWSLASQASRVRSTTTVGGSRDASQGLCYRPADLLNRSPGGDHFISHPPCPSRAGVLSSGQPSPGFGAGLQTLSSNGGSTYVPVTSQTLARQIADRVGTP